MKGHEALRRSRSVRRRSRTTITSRSLTPVRPRSTRRRAVSTSLAGRGTGSAGGTGSRGAASTRSTRCATSARDRRSSASDAKPEVRSATSSTSRRMDGASGKRSLGRADKARSTSSTRTRGRYRSSNDERVRIARPRPGQREAWLIIVVDRSSREHLQERTHREQIAPSIERLASRLFWREISEGPLDVLAVVACDPAWARAMPKSVRRTVPSVPRRTFEGRDRGE